MGYLFVFRVSRESRASSAISSRKWEFSHNGILPSIVIALGAVILLFMIRVMFGWTFGSPGLDAIIGSAAALILIPTEVAYRRRQKNRRR